MILNGFVLNWKRCRNPYGCGFFHVFHSQIFVTYAVLPTCYLPVTYSPIFRTFQDLPHPIFVFSFRHKKSTATPGDYGTFKPSGIFNSQNIFRTSQPQPLPQWNPQVPVFLHLGRVVVLPKSCVYLRRQAVTIPDRTKAKVLLHFVAVHVNS